MKVCRRNAGKIDMVFIDWISNTFLEITYNCFQSREYAAVVDLSNFHLFSLRSCCHTDESSTSDIIEMGMIMLFYCCRIVDVIGISMIKPLRILKPVICTATWSFVVIWAHSFYKFARITLVYRDLVLQNCTFCCIYVHVLHVHSLVNAMGGSMPLIACTQSCMYLSRRYRLFLCENYVSAAK